MRSGLPLASSIGSSNFRDQDNRTISPALSVWRWVDPGRQQPHLPPWLISMPEGVPCSHAQLSQRREVLAWRSNHPQLQGASVPISLPFRVKGFCPYWLCRHLPQNCESGSKKAPSTCASALGPPTLGIGGRNPGPKRIGAALVRTILPVRLGHWEGMHSTSPDQQGADIWNGRRCRSYTCGRLLPLFRGSV